MFRLVSILFCCMTLGAGAQDLCFSSVDIPLPAARTDRAPGTAFFKGHLLMAWKVPGLQGPVRTACMDRAVDGTLHGNRTTVEGSVTAFGPALVALKDRLYLFWIDSTGGLQYVLNTSDTGFAGATPQRLQGTASATGSGGPALAGGLSGAALAEGASDPARQDRLLLAARKAGGKQAVLLLAAPGQDGLLGPGNIRLIPGAETPDYPSVAALGDSTASFCWRASGSMRTAVWNGETWKNLTGPGKPRVAPTVCVVRASPVYLWMSPDHLCYAMGQGGTRATLFSTPFPVSVCKTSEDTSDLVFAGADQRLCMVNFFAYDPATWMQDILHTRESGKTLRDVVLPGAHDAGMSVLTAAGGTQSGTINECNTLTQSMPVSEQLKAGMRMFDLRVGTYKGLLYTKHCSADCMADAIGGGYGEQLAPLLDSIRAFLTTHRGEIVLLTFSHFCERETPVRDLADSVLDHLGETVAKAQRSINDIPLSELAGKVLVTFEGYARGDGSVDSCTIADHSGAGVNFRRAYAATDEIPKLLKRQATFFQDLAGSAHDNDPPGGVRENDLIRLDWQLTQSADEAAMTCNDFQDEKSGALLNGALLLTNIVRKHQSILSLSRDGNQLLAARLNDWIAQGLVNRRNKPNILYVDAAGAWITDYCAELNLSALYHK